MSKMIESKVSVLILWDGEIGDYMCCDMGRTICAHGDTRAEACERFDREWLKFEDEVNNKYFGVDREKPWSLSQCSREELKNMRIENNQLY